MLGHQPVQLDDRRVVHLLDAQPTLKQSGMIKVVQLIQHEIRTAEDERQLEQLIEQARVAEINPDVGVADVDPAHAETVDPCSAGSS